MNDKRDVSRGRRDFLKRGGAVVAVVAMSQGALFAGAAAPASAPEVSPLEDLMREHGLLSRILLIYDEVMRRLQVNAPGATAAAAGAADIVRRFVEDYHEKLEEEHIFPRFEKAGEQADLVKTLLAQHQAGRRLTDAIMPLAEAGARTRLARRQLGEHLRLFTRMYGPHKAREDTVLFPALHGLVSASEYDAMGDAFEDRERALFGEHGFETMVAKIADIEKRLGIYDLPRFTPRAQRPASRTVFS
jgi:hemerythrin-like domain-containing protein